MSQAKPPNVLIVVSDQHHPRFMGCAGHPFLQTPNMDRLADRGTRFNHAYCNFPLCGPSRWSFLTGRYASQINHLTNHDHRWGHWPTFAHAFSYGGYRTALVGRMHFNGPAHRFGFHEWLGGNLIEHSTGGRQRRLRSVLGPELQSVTGPNANAIRRSGPGRCGYLTYDEVLTDKATDWLRQYGAEKPDQPFAMLVGLVEPHAPFVAYPEDFYRYNDLISEDDLPRPHPETLHPENRRMQRRAKLEDAEPVSLKDQRRARVAYHGMCTFTDRMLGRFLDTLDEAGLTDDTIVVYTSDHGEQLGEHGMWWKHTFYEASAGIPMIMAGPGVPQRHVVERNVGLMDLPPTLLNLCEAPEVPGSQGRDMRCLLDGDPQRWPDQVIAENHWPPDSDRLHRMIRRGPWKLNYYPGFEPELFNLETDPNEMHDLASDPSCREIRRELETRLLAGWDHEAIMARHREEREAAKLMWHAMDQAKTGEPSEPWDAHVQPIVNEFDATV